MDQAALCHFLKQLQGRLRLTMGTPPPPPPPPSNSAAADTRNAVSPPCERASPRTAADRGGRGAARGGRGHRARPHAPAALALASVCRCRRGAGCACCDVNVRSPSRAIALARVCVWNLSVYGGAPDDVEEEAGYTNRMRHGGRGETRKRAGECLNNQRTACNTKPSAADSASLQPVCHEAVQSVSRKSGPGTDSPRRPRPTTSQHIVTSRCAHAFRQSHLEAFWSVA